jgi:hypothetical protein
MDELIVALRTLLEGVWGEITFTASEMARQLAFIRSRVSEDETDAEIYFRSVKRLGKIVILVPIPLFVVGIFTSCGPLMATMGLIWALFTVLFATAASPVAIFIASLAAADKKQDVADNVEHYMATVKKVLYAELAITICFLGIPMDNNPFAVPELAVVALFFLASGAKGKFGKRLLNTLAGIVAVMVLWSMFSPQSYNNLQSKLRAIDPWAAKIIGRAPATPPGGLTTNQEELNAAVAEAQAQAQAQAGSPTPSSQPTPPGMRGYAVQAEQPADIRFAEGEDTKKVEVPNGAFTPWIFLPTAPRGGGSFTTTITPPLGPGQAIIVYCLDGRVFTRTAEHNPVIAPGPQAVSLMGKGWTGVATVRILRTGH